MSSFSFQIRANYIRQTGKVTNVNINMSQSSICTQLRKQVGEDGTSRCKFNQLFVDFRISFYVELKYQLFPQISVPNVYFSEEEKELSKDTIKHHMVLQRRGRQKLFKMKVIDMRQISSTTSLHTNPGFQTSINIDIF